MAFLSIHERPRKWVDVAQSTFKLIVGGSRPRTSNKRSTRPYGFKLKKKGASSLDGNRSRFFFSTLLDGGRAFGRKRDAGITIGCGRITATFFRDFPRRKFHHSAVHSGARTYTRQHGGPPAAVHRRLPVILVDATKGILSQTRRPLFHRFRCLGHTQFFSVAASTRWISPTIRKMCFLCS